MSQQKSVRRRSVALAAAFAAALLAGASATRAVGDDDPAATYKIELDRPVKVGQEYAVTSKTDAHETSKLSLNGQARENDEKFTVEMAGTIKVLAVNDKVGTPTKVRLTIDKLTKDGAEVFPAGTVITADHTGEKARFMVGGGEVSDEQAAVLDTAVDLESAEKTVTEDQATGTAEKQAVGGTWDGSAEKLAASMVEDHLPVSAEHVKAKSKLVEVKPVDGVPSEVVETKLDVDALDKDKDFHGLTVTEGTVTGTVTETLPADDATPATVLDQHFVVKVKGTAGDGAMTADITSDRTIHRTMVLKK